MLLQRLLLTLALGIAWASASASTPSQDHVDVLHARDMASPDPPHYTPRPFIGVPIDAASNRIAADPPRAWHKVDPSKKPFSFNVSVLGSFIPLNTIVLTLSPPPVQSRQLGAIAPKEKGRRQLTPIFTSYDPSLPWPANGERDAGNPVLPPPHLPVIPSTHQLCRLKTSETWRPEQIPGAKVSR